MKEYLKSSADVMAELSTTPDGLTETDAAAKLAQNGKNKLVEGKKESLLHRFFKQLAEPMTIILIVAAVISGVMAVMENEFPADVIIIMAVVVINAVLGVVQESKAEKAIEALQEIAAATSKVIRGGHQMTVKSEELVTGDIIVLEAGDAVPADARIIECASMKIEEAALTGESVPVTKTDKTLDAGQNGDVALGDRKNMVFMGSTVVYGRGKAVVTATGMDTEMGKIADALAKAEEGKTPLQQKLGQLSKILTYLVVGICVVIFAINLIRSLAVGDGLSVDIVLNTFMVAVSLAVAAIPEGLATVVTIVLSIGVTNMSKRNAIIRKLTAVETLGCTQIICSDKTGTLTQNKMTVVDHYGDNENLLATAMSLCSDAELDTEAGEAVGEPTECALVNYAAKLGLDKNTQKTEFLRIGEVPFDSMRKMMSTVHKTENGGIIQFTKGAPDEILKRCTKALVNGTAVPLTPELRAEILAANKAMADKALRVLAAAMKKLSEAPAVYESEAIENELCFIGLCGMIDPVRPEVRPAIDECRSAGIRPIMITGDHKVTAAAIAKQVGVDQFFAEVLPEDKAAFVQKAKSEGHTVVMIGDGINDSPALSAADVGIAINSGAAIAREIADVTIKADSLEELVILKTIANSLQRRVSANYHFVLTFNSALIALGAMGILQPASSAMLHNLSTIGISLKSMTNLIPEEKAQKALAEKN